MWPFVRSEKFDVVFTVRSETYGKVLESEAEKARDFMGGFEKVD